MPTDSGPDEERTASPDDPEHERSDGLWRTSRRRILGATAAMGVASGLAGANLNQQATGIQLLGVAEAWKYEGDTSAPYIGGSSTDNPTLQLQAGQQYEVTWENGDGAPHNFVIVDDQGNNLVRTEIMSEQGATQSVTFTASAEMSEYLCEVHPNTMRGSVETSGSGSEGTGTETPMDQGGFFAPGTEVGYKTVAEGMTAPTDFAVAEEDEERYFVADQTGEVWIVTPEGGRQDEPFINVSDRMVELGTFYGSYASQTQDYDERGLLGVEFHPDFQNNRKVYLHYSAPPTQELKDMGWDHIEVVSEFMANEDGSSADPQSETQLLSIPSPQYNHDSGPIAFGPDGYLYVPMGDGGGANDDMYGHVDDWYDVNAGGNGQDVEENMLGDILRIDVDSEGGGGTNVNGDSRNYGIPEDNPFAGEDSPGVDEIYAYGFRNPFGISFDSQGNCFVADAGQNLWEEASVVERGGNYGWNVKEGTHCFSTENPSEVDAITDCPDTEPTEAPYDGSELQDPIVEYPHTYQGESVGIVIIGGHRYETDTVSGLSGKYVFGEWTTDPTRGEPGGRVLAATPPEGFDGGGMGTPSDDETETETENGTETETGIGTANETETDSGTVTDTPMETGTSNATNGTDGPSGKTTPDETPGANETATDTGEVGNETSTGTGTETGTPSGASEGDVPLDQLWEMEELVFTNGFNFFVRQFGRDNDGEIYVLVNRMGVPQGDTGRLVRIVPPEEGETPSGTETPTGTETDTPAENGTDTAANETSGTDGPSGKTTPDETPGANETTTTTNTTTTDG